MARSRLAQCIALFIVAAFSPADAFAGWLSFSAHLQANTGQFRITNLSDEGFDLTGLVIQLGDNAAFATSVLTLAGIDDHGPTLTFPALASVVMNNSTSAVFDFTGFGIGDTFGFSTTFADVLNGGPAAGSDFNNAVIMASFANGQTLITTFAGGPTTPSGNRKSFVFTATTEAVAALHSPEPQSAVLLVIGLAFGGMYRFRGRLFSGATPS